MSDVHDLVAKVEASEAFRQFKRAHKEQYLVHLFCHAKEEAKVEIGYYGAEDDTITTFTTDPVERKPPEEVFKREGTLEELDLGEVEVGLSRAREIAEAYRREHYPAHPVTQEICILQRLGIQVWNLTLVTSTLNMLNIRIAAHSGEIISAEMRNILDLRAKE